MKINEGDKVVSEFDGKDYIIAKIGDHMVVLKSEDGNKQIMTGVDSLKIFYKKKEEVKS